MGVTQKLDSKLITICIANATFPLPSVAGTLKVYSWVSKMGGGALPAWICLCFFLFLACICSELRLSGSDSYYEGRVEVCSEGVLETVIPCDENWQDIHAQVVCQQLGFFNPGKMTRVCMSLVTPAL